MTSEPSASHFVIDGDMAAPLAVPVAGGRAVVFSSRSPERSGPNEDGAIIVPVGPRRGVLALADGFGGHPSGAEASRIALEAVEASVRGRDPSLDELRTAILDGFEAANENVRALGVGAATTLAVVEIDEQWIRPYHVGDSGIVVVGQRGRLKLRTVDHSPAGYALEAGMIDEDEAMVHEERHLVTNIVGSAEMRIEMGPSLQLAPRDTVIVASDGLFDNLAFGDIVDAVRRGRLVPRVAAMAAAGRERMRDASGAQPSKPDDLTVLAFRRHA